MTEKEWLAATDPTPMVAFISRTASDRKLQLFSVSLVWAHHERFPEALLALTRAAELRADGRLQPDHQCNAERGKKEWMDQMKAEYGEFRAWPESAKYASVATELTYMLPQIWLRWTAEEWRLPGDVGIAYRAGSKITHSSQPLLLREAFGNPFRPVSADTTWLTSTVVHLAQGIYEEKAFDRMPILADALQDAGCDNQDILIHCRSEGPHVRGCWVVDLLTGRK